MRDRAAGGRRQQADTDAPLAKQHDEALTCSLYGEENYQEMHVDGGAFVQSFLFIRRR